MFYFNDVGLEDVRRRTPALKEQYAFESCLVVRLKSFRPKSFFKGCKTIKKKWIDTKTKTKEQMDFLRSFHLLFPQ